MSDQPSPATDHSPLITEQGGIVPPPDDMDITDEPVPSPPAIAPEPPKGVDLYR